MRPATSPTIRVRCPGASIYSIRLDAPIGDYVWYLPLQVTVGAAPPLKLTCSQGTVRGQIVSCTVKATDTTQSVVTTGWSFTSTDGSRVDREPAWVAQPTWSGRLVLGGRIAVAATVGGEPWETSAPVTIAPRDWTGRVSMKDHLVISPSALNARPTGFEGQLGSTVLTLPSSPDVGRWLGTIESDADEPNRGFTYLLDVPITSTTRPDVNTNALAVNSDFYKIQETRAKTIGGIAFCGQSFVTGIIPLVQAHEGTDPSTQPNSHAGIFRRHVDSLAATRFEPVAGPASTSFEGLRSALFTEASQDAAAMDNDSRNNLTSVTVPCQFRYDYSRLK